MCCKSAGRAVIVKNQHRARRLCLENLAVELIKLCIKWRKEIRQKNNFSGIQKSILNSIIKTGESINNIIRPIENNERLENRKYCGLCTGLNRLKSNIACLKCKTVICSAKHTCSYCTKCNLNLN